MPFACFLRMFSCTRHEVMLGDGLIYGTISRVPRMRSTVQSRQKKSRDKANSQQRFTTRTCHMSLSPCLMLSEFQGENQQELDKRLKPACAV